MFALARVAHVCHVFGVAPDCLFRIMGLGGLAESQLLRDFDDFCLTLGREGILCFCRLLAHERSLGKSPPVDSEATQKTATGHVLCALCSQRWTEDRHASPLSRAWCLFEVFHTMLISGGCSALALSASSTRCSQQLLQCFGFERVLLCVEAFGGRPKTWFPGPAFGFQTEPVRSTTLRT